MKALHLVKNAVSAHKYISIALSLVVIGGGSVAAIQYIPATHTDWSKPKTQSTQPSSTASQPNSSSPPLDPTGSSSTIGSNTPSTTSPTAPSTSTTPTTTTIPAQNTNPTSDNPNATTAPTPTCNTTSEAEYQSQYETTYNQDRDNAIYQITQTGYSSPFVSNAAIAAVTPIEQALQTKITNLKIQWIRDVDSINCYTATLPTMGSGFLYY